jgi:hypothetical protein
MEAEARAILTEVCVGNGPENVAENITGLIAGLYRGTPPKNKAEKLIAERRREAQREL